MALGRKLRERPREIHRVLATRRVLRLEEQHDLGAR